MCIMYIVHIYKMLYNISKGGDIMAYSEAQKKATAKYMKNKLDDIKVRVPKGKREVYKAHAERQGKSLNALIIELLEKNMQEH